MLTKLKLALALSASLIGGVAGVAAAQGTPSSDAPKAEIFKKYDANGDGKLSPEERATMRADFKAKREARKAAMIAKYDSNKNGKLDPEERKVMKEERLALQFEKMDTDHNGSVTLSEFKAFQSNKLEHHHARRGHLEGGKRSGRGLRGPGGTKGTR